MTEPNRQSGEKEERIIEIEIERLRPFKEHPFQVKDDKEMFLLQESIEKYGILNPLIVRPVPDGYYEIISGHRRKHAAEKLGYRKVPVIIRVLSEDDSILSMVDSNLHRERISYSEKAFAYKLKNDVLKRKSGRKKSQVDHKTPRKRAIEIISEDCGDSPKQVQRYISLTKLIPEMLQKLDDEIISFCPAVEIAALSEKEQKELFHHREFEERMHLQWNMDRQKELDDEVGRKMWKMVRQKCLDCRQQKKHVYIPYWLSVAAVALVLLLGATWMYFSGNKVNEAKDAFVEVVSKEGRLYMLPDSSRVWMHPGSSIRYPENFVQNRKVWLKGNSHFDVYKQDGKHFIVYIDRAFVEVKGTSFLINQEQANISKVTLFSGKVDFTIVGTEHTLSLIHI